MFNPSLECSGAVRISLRKNELSLNQRASANGEAQSTERIAGRRMIERAGKILVVSMKFKDMREKPMEKWHIVRF
jgi:hypothetical protein